MTRKMVAEFIGTFVLVFSGVGAAVIAGAAIGYAGISLAFGISIVAAADALGAIPGRT